MPTWCSKSLTLRCTLHILVLFLTQMTLCPVKPRTPSPVPAALWPLSHPQVELQVVAIHVVSRAAGALPFELVDAARSDVSEGGGQLCMCCEGMCTDRISSQLCVKGVLMSQAAVPGEGWEGEGWEGEGWEGTCTDRMSRQDTQWVPSCMQGFSVWVSPARLAAMHYGWLGPGVITGPPQQHSSSSSSSMWSRMPHTHTLPASHPLPRPCMMYSTQHTHRTTTVT